MKAKKDGEKNPKNDDSSKKEPIPEDKKDEKRNPKNEPKDSKKKESIPEDKKDEKKNPKTKTKDTKEKETIPEEIPYSCIPRLEDKYKDLSYEK